MHQHYVLYMFLLICQVSGRELLLLVNDLSLLLRLAIVADRSN